MQEVNDEYVEKGNVIEGLSKWMGPSLHLYCS